MRALDGGFGAELVGISEGSGSVFGLCSVEPSEAVTGARSELLTLQLASLPLAGGAVLILNASATAKIRTASRITARMGLIWVTVF